jgi:crotonobetainyl-CoA:carnitine CoA-transferase CaiB-like acyl-CoA transferase
MTALSGLKVVDLSSTRAGAQATQVLADFGAEVVWIEPPGGSPLRRSAAFPMLGRGKKSLVLDLDDPGDLEHLHRIISGADVLVECLSAAERSKLGIERQQLDAANPRLVHASISAFGSSGPYRDVPFHEELVLARLGVYQLFQKSRPNEFRPPFNAVPWASFPAAMLIIVGIASALHERKRSGLGQHVETNLAQAFACLDTWEWFIHLVNSRYPGAYPGSESFDENGIPTSPLQFMLLIAQTSDGHWLQFAEVGPQLFGPFMKALGLEWMFTDPEWAGIPVFDDPAKRSEFWSLMLLAASEKSLAEWEAIFEADRNVFAEQFRRGAEVLDHAQLVADDFPRVIVDPTVGPVRQPGPLVDMRKTPASVTVPAPLLGSTSTSEIEWEPADPAPSGPARDLPLGDVTVLEMAVLYAAPYGATVLTDLGARVIKVESLEGDQIRNLVPFPELAGAKVLQGKESIAIDLGTPEGLEIVKKIAAMSDIALQGFRAGVADRIGVGYEQLAAVNPDLVYLHSPGYGEGPPDGHRPAYAPSIGAAGGVPVAVLGQRLPGERLEDLQDYRAWSRRISPAGMAAEAQPDGMAAVGVAANLMLGLAASDHGAGGQHLVSSMIYTVASAMCEEILGDGDVGIDEEKRGTGPLNQMYDAADGWVFLSVTSDAEWDRLCDALASRVDLRQEFSSTEQRDRSAGALRSVLADVFRTQGAVQWEEELLPQGVGCMRVCLEKSVKVLQDESLGVPSGYVVEVDHPTFGPHDRLAPAIRFSRSETTARGGELLGASTDSIMRELGYSDAEIADLRERKIIG